MRLLVLGGTRFVGRAAVEVALGRGVEVTVLNRGVTGVVPDGVRHLRADRTDPVALAAALDDQEWDVVLDTWSGAPAVLRAGARLLAERVGHYAYVSSRSVYRSPIPLWADEQVPTVEACACDEDSTDYARSKRGGELAVLESFAGRCLFARAGLVLGPYENVGRLVWWLRRLERGGQVLVPGPPELPLQYIDARDLTGWMLSAAERGVVGEFNTVSPPGWTTTAELLSVVAEVTGAEAEFVWLGAEQLHAAGISEWVELPIWLDPAGENAGLHAGDVSRALGAGLSCRPVRATVADTWAWMQAEGEPEPPAGWPVPGLDPVKESQVLARFAR